MFFKNQLMGMSWSSFTVPPLFPLASEALVVAVSLRQVQSPHTFSAESFSRFQAVRIDLREFFRSVETKTGALASSATDRYGNLYELKKCEEEGTSALDVWQPVQCVSDDGSDQLSVFFRSFGGCEVLLAMPRGLGLALGIPLNDQDANGRFDGHVGLPRFRINLTSPGAGANFNPYFREEELVLGQAWLRAKSQSSNIALASMKGTTDKAKENQDRFAFTYLPDGRPFMAVIDGMGGYGGAEHAAEIIRVTLVEWALQNNFPLSLGLEMANEAVVRANAVSKGKGGATFACVTDKTQESLEVRTVGDSEFLLLEMPEEEQTTPEISFWSTRPTPSQYKTYGIPVLSDGRAALGAERILRLDPDSNIVDQGIGIEPGPLRQYTDEVPLRKGKTYLALLMTDGLSEQFISHAEIVAIIGASGAKTPAEVRGVLMEEALIRCSLANVQRRIQKQTQDDQIGSGFAAQSVPMEITYEKWRQAYREMFLELYGEEREPPADARAAYEGHWLVGPGKGSCYVVDAEAIDFSTGQLRINPVTADSSLVFGRFKEDNISIAVRLLQP